MSDNNAPPIGSILWRDLTVENADKIRDFYKEVVGWQPQAQSMGEYNDYNMLSPDNNENMAGICHKKGTNAKLPSYWLIYITVKNLDDSIEKCTSLGGKVIDGPKNMGISRYCIIEDPAGAVCALYQP